MANMTGMCVTCCRIDTNHADGCPVVAGDDLFWEWSKAHGYEKLTAYQVWQAAFLAGSTIKGIEEL